MTCGALLVGLSTGWYSAGAVNPTVLRNWERQGGKVLVKLPPQPGWSVLVHRRHAHELRPALLASLTSAKTSDSGKAALAAVKVDGFVAAEDKEYVAVLQYLDAPARVAKQ